MANPLSTLWSGVVGVYRSITQPPRQDDGPLDNIPAVSSDPNELDRETIINTPHLREEMMYQLEAYGSKGGGDPVVTTLRPNQSDAADYLVREVRTATFERVVVDLDLRGTSSGDNLTGGQGSDTLYGRAGNDLLRGGAGRDDLVGGKGRDLLYGNEGNDSLLMSEGDQGWGGQGSDVFKVKAGASVTIQDFDMEEGDRFDFRELGDVELVSWSYAKDPHFYLSHMKVHTISLDELWFQGENGEIVHVEADFAGYMFKGGYSAFVEPSMAIFDEFIL